MSIHILWVMDGLTYCLPHITSAMYYSHASFQCDLTHSFTVLLSFGHHTPAIHLTTTDLPQHFSYILSIPSFDTTPFSGSVTVSLNCLHSAIFFTLHVLLNVLISTALTLTSYPHGMFVFHIISLVPEASKFK